MIKMNIPVIFQFLKDLSANNNRDWFNEHRAEYETARVEFENFLATVIARISLFDESIRGIQPKDCTYRIYRDTRFSTDKTPYKIHFGGYINAKGKKSDHCGYYVHLQPAGSMLAGGSLCLPSNVLKAVRQSIYDNIEEFVAIVEDPEFKKILETPEKTLDGLVQMLAARLADDYCLEVIRDEAADDEKKELEKRLERALEDAARTIDERDGKLYAILEDTKPMAFSVI